MSDDSAATAPPHHCVSTSRTSGVVRVRLVPFSLLIVPVDTGKLTRRP